MTAQILDGKALAKTIQQELATQVEAFKADTQVTPTLATVLVGNDPASEVYIRNKIRSCERIGMISRHIELAADTSQQELLSTVDQLNNDATVHGILVQLPLPNGLQAQPVLDAIRADKDVDAFHAENVGLVSQGRPRFLPCNLRESHPKALIQLSGHRKLDRASDRFVW